ncbi:MAG: hypothetical protein RLZZ443_755 [Actinomycetota bacterium]|jgi:hypothetical protein
MSKIARLGWKNFVTAWMVVTIGLIPEFIFVVIASLNPLQKLTAVGSLLLIGIGFGIVIGWPLEALLLPRYKSLTLFKIYGTYSLAGFVVALIVNAYFYLPSALAGGVVPPTFVYALLTVLLMFVPYMVTMLIARGIYPVLHRKLFNEDAANTPGKIDLSQRA